MRMRVRVRVGEGCENAHLIFGNKKTSQPSWKRSRTGIHVRTCPAPWEDERSCWASKRSEAGVSSGPSHPMHSRSARAVEGQARDPCTKGLARLAVPSSGTLLRSPRASTSDGTSTIRFSWDPGVVGILSLLLPSPAQAWPHVPGHGMRWDPARPTGLSSERVAVSESNEDIDTRRAALRIRVCMPPRTARFSSFSPMPV